MRLTAQEAQAILQAYVPKANKIHNVPCATASVSKTAFEGLCLTLIIRPDWQRDDQVNIYVPFLISGYEVNLYI